MEEGTADETKPLSLHRAVSVIPYLHGDRPSVTFPPGLLLRDLRDSVVQRPSGVRAHFPGVNCGRPGAPGLRSRPSASSAVRFPFGIDPGRRLNRSIVPFP